MAETTATGGFGDSEGFGDSSSSGGSGGSGGSGDWTQRLGVADPADGRPGGGLPGEFTELDSRLVRAMFRSIGEFETLAAEHGMDDEARARWAARYEVKRAIHDRLDVIWRLLQVRIAQFAPLAVEGLAKIATDPKTRPETARRACMDLLRHLIPAAEGGKRNAPTETRSERFRRTMAPYLVALHQLETTQTTNPPETPEAPETPEVPKTATNATPESCEATSGASGGSGGSGGCGADPRLRFSAPDAPEERPPRRPASPPRPPIPRRPQPAARTPAPHRRRPWRRADRPGRRRRRCTGRVGVGAQEHPLAAVRADGRDLRAAVLRAQIAGHDGHLHQRGGRAVRPRGRRRPRNRAPPQVPPARAGRPTRCAAARSSGDPPPARHVSDRPGRHGGPAWR